MIAVTADPRSAIRESNEANNSASTVVRVRRNQVRNGDFQTTSNGTRPDNWQPSGTTSYDQSPDGNRSASASPGGSWTSDAVDVTPGIAYGITADATGGTVAIEQLSALGAVLSTVTGTTSFTAGAGVTQVRVKLLGGLAGVATFDNVRLFEE
jgi:hypothetical protein